MTNKQITSARSRVASACILLLAFSLIPNWAAADCSKKGDPGAPNAMYFDEWFMSTGLCLIQDTAENQGMKIVSGLGKSLLSSALNSVVPGLSSIFGLGGGGSGFERWANEIIDVVRAEADGIHSHLDAFWTWARDTRHAQISADFATAYDLLLTWQTMTVEEKLHQIDTLNFLYADFTSLRHEMAMIPDPHDKVRWLHTYGQVVDLTLVLAAEQATLTVLAPVVFNDSRYQGDLAEYYNQISSSERQDILERTTTNTEDRWAIILHDGYDSVFDVLADINQAFEAVAESRFGTPVSCPGSLSPMWSYVVDNSPRALACQGVEPDCEALMEVDDIQYEECQRYFKIYTQGSDNYRGIFADVQASDGEALHDYHRWLVYGDMLVDGYGPMRRKLDLWWRFLHDGPREYTATDRDLDGYLRGTSPYESYLYTKATWGSPTKLFQIQQQSLATCTRLDDASPENTSVATAYFLEHGYWVGLTMCIAQVGDPLSTRPAPYEDLEEVMLTDESFGAFYQRQFAAKFAVL